MKPRNFVIFLNLLFLLSCSEELTRDNAAKILTETFHYPSAEFTKCVLNAEVNTKYGTNLVDKANPQSGKPEIADISSLVNEGFVDQGEYRKPWNACAGAVLVYTYRFKDKAQAYVRPGTDIQSSKSYQSGEFIFCTRNIMEIKAFNST